MEGFLTMQIFAPAKFAFSSRLEEICHHKPVLRTTECVRHIMSIYTNLNCLLRYKQHIGVNSGHMIMNDNDHSKSEYHLPPVYQSLYINSCKDANNQKSSPIALFGTPRQSQA